MKTTGWPIVDIFEGYKNKTNKKQNIGWELEN